MKKKLLNTVWSLDYLQVSEDQCHETKSRHRLSETFYNSVTQITDLVTLYYQKRERRWSELLQTQRKVIKSNFSLRSPVISSELRKEESCIYGM